MGESVEKENEYSGTALKRFDHFFGNKIGFIRRELIDAKEKNLKPNQVRIKAAFEQFIQGLHTILKELKESSTKPHPKVGEREIREFFAVCENMDPCDKQQ